MSVREPLVATLAAIEERVEENLTVSELSRAAYLSGSHLQRLFSLATGQPLMAYVRGRKLAHSLVDLLDSPLRVIEIAHKYGFDHEQSYIRAFRREFGCTPGFARSHRAILPVRERIDPESLSAVGQGVLSGPDVVMVPSFYAVGRAHLLVGFDDYRDASQPNEKAVKFMAQDVLRIANLATPPTYIGLNTVMEPAGPDVEYFASMHVTGTRSVPAGLELRTVPTRLCAQFRYVGEHLVTDITMDTARSLYDSIDWYFGTQNRFRIAENWFFERIDSSHQDDTYCQMQWLRPVVEA